MNEKTRKLTLMAMFTALAYVLMAVGRIPISSVEYLKYDPKDVMLVICGLAMGPVPCALVTVCVSLIEMLTVSSSGIIGFVMNVVASVSFAGTASLIYAKKHTLRRAVIGLIAGTLAMTAMMLVWNYFITPFYTGYPREAVAAMLAPIFLPFNLIKGGINASIVMLIYKSVMRALGAVHMAEYHAPTADARTTRIIMIASAAVIVICVFVILFIRGIL